MFEKLKEHFREAHIILDDNFLKQFVNWIGTEQPNATWDEITAALYREWLTLDLEDVHVSVLPPNISETIHTKLNNTICLQILNVVDISKPKYLQLQSIRNENAHQSEEVDSHGMLKLVLTDGVQKISAIEYKKVPCLNLSMEPGMKVRLQPPIIIRRGQIMLEPQMIEMLGGCVPEIGVIMCVENVLASALNQKLNMKPRNVSTNRALLEASSDEQQNATNSTTVQDESRMDSNLLTVANEFDEICNDKFFDAHFEANNIQNSPKMPPGNELRPANSLPITPNHSGRSNEILSTPVAVVAPIKGHTTKIAKLNDIRSMLTMGIFEVHIEILSISEKLKLDNNNYSMKVVVADNSGEMEAQLSSMVLTDLIKIKPETYYLMQTDPNAYNMEWERLSNDLPNTLNNFYGRVRIKMESNKDPIVTKILEILSTSQ